MTGIYSEKGTCSICGCKGTKIMNMPGYLMYLTSNSDEILCKTCATILEKYDYQLYHCKICGKSLYGRRKISPKKSRCYCLQCYIKKVGD